jgi:uncharacterized OsmC-like protein
VVQTAEQPVMRNGVNIDQLFGTLDVIKGAPELARITFKARNRWIDGPHNQSVIQHFQGAGQEQLRDEPFVVDAGEPQLLIGNDEGPNPAEYLLHAIAACLTTSLVYVASARKVRLIEVESHVEGDLDALGALGLSDDVRNGYQEIRVSFRIEADATAEQVQDLIERAKSRSVVFDTLTRGTNVQVSVQS